MATSPTQRTTAELRKRAWPYQIVEYWNYYAKKRVDLWGIGDILCLDGKPGSLLLQVSSDSGHSARVKKALGIPVLKTWLEAGNRFAVWTWGLRGKRGEKKKWTLRESSLQPEDFGDGNGKG